MTRLLLAGSVAAGKTTLAHRLADDGLCAGKTQAMTLIGDVVDTPGEYLDHGRFNHALLLASYDADVVVLVQSATDGDSRIPPGFASWFTCPVVGVVSQIDVAPPQRVTRAREQLALAGASPVVELSAVTGDGLSDFLSMLEEVAG